MSPPQGGSADGGIAEAAAPWDCRDEEHGLAPVQGGSSSSTASGGSQEANATGNGGTRQNKTGGPKSGGICGSGSGSGWSLPPAAPLLVGTSTGGSASPTSGSAGNGAGGGKSPPNMPNAAMTSRSHATGSGGSATSDSGSSSGSGGSGGSAGSATNTGSASRGERERGPATKTPTRWAIQARAGGSGGTTRRRWITTAAATTSGAGTANTGLRRCCDWLSKKGCFHRQHQREHWWRRPIGVAASPPTRRLAATKTEAATRAAIN